MNILDQFTDKQLEEELQRRREASAEEYKKKVNTCIHDFERISSNCYESWYFCKKCGYEYSRGC